MQRQVTKEKYILDDQGRVIGKETVVEWFMDTDLAAEEDRAKKAAFIEAEEVKYVAIQE